MKRKTVIRSIDVLSLDTPSAFLRVSCASGTYIRSLAEAIGEGAGCGAYLSSLRRESVGNARVEGAYGLDYLAARASLGQEMPSPEAVDDYLELPVIEVAADADTVIHHGQQLVPAMITRIIGEFAAHANVAISVEGYGVVAVGKAMVASGAIRAGSAGASPSQEIGPILSYQCVLI
jgi:tRNA U55 pseudouridine synthase TruB